MKILVSRLNLNQQPAVYTTRSAKFASENHCAPALATLEQVESSYLGTHVY